MTISEEAVDAAFAQLPDDFVIHSRGSMRRMLEAAAPHMLGECEAEAEGLEDAADAYPTYGLNRPAR